MTLNSAAFAGCKHSLVLLVALAAAPLALAQAPTFTAEVTGYTAIGNTAPPESAWQHIDVARDDGPLRAQASGSGGQLIVIPGSLVAPGTTTGPGQSSGSVSGSALAEPGSLHVYGADRAIAIGAYTGVGMRRAQDPATVYANIDAAASFTDSLTVHAAGLAVGAAVQIPFRYGAEFTNDSGFVSQGINPINVSMTFNVPRLGPQTFRSDSGFFDPSETYNGAYFLDTIQSNDILVTVHVGDVLPISASFAVYGDARLYAPDPEFGNFGGYIDARDTAGIWLGDLPAGVTVSSASGHDYTVDPLLSTVAAAVPEPQTEALMLGGLVCVALVLARRKQSTAQPSECSP